MEINGLPVSSQTTEGSAVQGVKSGADLQQADSGTAMAYGYKKTEQENLLRIGGDPAEIRTPDTLLKRQVLCRLSYWIKCINRPKSVYRTAVQRMEVPSTNMKKMIARTFVIFASFASLVRPLFFP